MYLSALRLCGTLFLFGWNRDDVLQRRTKLRRTISDFEDKYSVSILESVKPPKETIQSSGRCFKCHLCHKHSKFKATLNSVRKHNSMNIEFNTKSTSKCKLKSQKFLFNE